MGHQRPTGVMSPQAKELQGWLDGRQPPNARREAWNRLSLRASGGNQLCQHLAFELLASRTVRKHVSVVLSPPAPRDFVMQPGRLIQGLLWADLIHWVKAFGPHPAAWEADFSATE